MIPIKAMSILRLVITALDDASLIATQGINQNIFMKNFEYLVDEIIVYFNLKMF